MADPDPIRRDLAVRRAQRRLPPGTRCLLCGEQDPEILRREDDAKLSASVLEVHHLVGAVNDPDETVVLCLNCHRRMSARMHAYGVQLHRAVEQSGVERTVSLLRALAVFCEQLAAALMRWAHDLANDSGSREG